MILSIMLPLILKFGGEKGRIAVKLDDNTKEIVSRRKIKEVINFLDERGI